jgi:hypothetical protein
MQPEERCRPWPLGRCYYCICKICNLRYCRYKTRQKRCYMCHLLNNVPLLECDGFESIYKQKVYRISRSEKLRRKSLREMVEVIYHKMVK